MHGGGCQAAQMLRSQIPRSQVASHISTGAGCSWRFLFSQTRLLNKRLAGTKHSTFQETDNGLGFGFVVCFFIYMHAHTPRQIHPPPSHSHYNTQHQCAFIFFAVIACWVLSEVTKVKPIGKKEEGELPQIQSTPQKTGARSFELRASTSTSTSI